MELQDGAMACRAEAACPAALYAFAVRDKVRKFVRETRWQHFYRHKHTAIAWSICETSVYPLDAPLLRVVRVEEARFQAEKAMIW